MARIVQPTDEAIAQAAAIVRAGGAVAFPTETVYGLGADTFNRHGLELIYDLKGRPASNPLIAHVLDSAQAQRIVTTWDGRCERLAARFWPGPLTFVLPKAATVPDRATAGLPTIAVRAPSHPVARRLLLAAQTPISAPSANRSGHVSPTRADHVADDFAECEDLMILDGGASELGIESTVLDLTGSRPRVLRPGSVTVEQLRGVLSEVDAPMVSVQAASPGTSALHYAPNTRAELVASEALEARLRESHQPQAVLCFDPRRVPLPHKAIVMPPSAHEYARRLYDALREADELKCARIIIEQPPEETDLWRAISDRLRRAAT